MKSAAIIIATTGAPDVRSAIQSALAQTHSLIRVWVVVDGPEFLEAFTSSTSGLELLDANVVVLPENVGMNGFYGHRIYAAFTHLVNAEYVLYLDQDNWLDAEHVATMVETIEKENLDWCYALRKICDKSGSFLLNDDCESLGAWPAWTNTKLVDTSAYCLRHEVAVRIASLWHGKWGQDRVVFSALSQQFPKFHCTGRYTVNYRLGENPGLATSEFFEKGNAIMQQRYPAGFPWRASHND